MVRRLLGKELLFEEFENRRDPDRYSVPLLDMARRRRTEHHQSSFGVPQVIYVGSSMIKCIGRLPVSAYVPCRQVPGC